MGGLPLLLYTRILNRGLRSEATPGQRSQPTAAANAVEPATETVLELDVRMLALTGAWNAALSKP